MQHSHKINENHSHGGENLNSHNAWMILTSNTQHYPLSLFSKPSHALLIVITLLRLHLNTTYLHLHTVNTNVVTNLQSLHCTPIILIPPLHHHHTYNLKCCLHHHHHCPWCLENWTNMILGKWSRLVEIFSLNQTNQH